MAKKKSAGLLLCVRNDGYRTSLEVGKDYRTLEDAQAQSKNFVRVIDESGEAYLFPADCFEGIAVAPTAPDAILNWMRNGDPNH